MREKKRQTTPDGEPMDPSVSAPVSLAMLDALAPVPPQSITRCRRSGHAVPQLDQCAPPAACFSAGLDLRGPKLNWTKNRCAPLCFLGFLSFRCVPGKALPKANPLR